MLKKLLCDKNESLIVALQKINLNVKGIVFIVDKDRLCGVLTDGDIRRLLLAGHNLQESIASVLKKDFVWAKRDESYSEMMKKVNNKIWIIPVVDDNFKVVDYFECKRNIHMPVASPDLRGNEFKYLFDAFLSSWVSSKGAYIQKFEDGFAKFCECGYGAATSSGTTALHLALLALGIGKGDQVIVPDLTFAATINAVLYCGATPVIVDIEKESWCIDPNQIKKALGARTKAIIPVHLYGQPCDMSAIKGIAKKHGIAIIEDCAEAHGARFAGRKVGSFGDIGCFSFYGNKIITTGEGGMCVTNSRKLYNKILILRDHGMSRTKKYWHEIIGYNYRMTNLQAAIGVAQLERIDFINRFRRGIEDKYRRSFSGIKFLEFQRDDLPKRKKITWLVSILVKNNKRDEYIRKLKNKGIDTRPFFYPLSRMPIYKKYVFSNKNSCEISKEGISLPTTPDIDFKKIREIFCR